MPQSPDRPAGEAGPRVRQAAALPRTDAVPGAGDLTPAAPAQRRRVAPSAVTVLGGPPGPPPAARRGEAWLVVVKVAVAVLVATPFAVTLLSARGQLARQVSDGRRPKAAGPATPAPSRSRRSPSPEPSPSRSARPARARPSPSASGAVEVGPPRRASPSRRPPPHVRSHLLVSLASDRCVTVPGGRPRDGLRLEIRDCAGGPGQRWTFEPDRTVRSLGMCMDVAYGSSDDGAVVQLVNCHGGPAQHFVLNRAGDLVNLGSGKCVDVTDMRTANGTALQQWECGGTSNQKWSLG